VLGGVGRLCRRCCWFQLERSDGRVEEGGGQLYHWLNEKLGPPGQRSLSRTLTGAQLPDK